MERETQERLMNDLNSSSLPYVSIIIPSRNEERFIGKCLDSIIAQEYPKDRMEVLIVDGMSEDRTREIVSGYVKKYPFIKVLDNPKRVTPVGMNIGIKNAKGSLIVILNAHSYIEPNFLKTGVELLKKSGADAVGGRLTTVPEGNGLVSKAMPLALDSIFGAGGKRYRSRTKEGFVYDTLPYCLYRREVFDKIGLIDDELIRDQDEEFNYRLIRSGGRIFYSPEIRSFLHSRNALKKLWSQHFQYGYFKPLVTKKVGATLSWRQMVPALFISALVLTGILSFAFRPLFLFFVLLVSTYLCVNLGFSFLISYKKGLKYLFVLPLIFVVLHFGYGLGYIKGIVDFLLFRKHKKRKILDLKLTR